MSDVPLDMRMNQEQQINAKEILNNFSEDELIQIFRNYGNVPFIKSLVYDIVNSRKTKPIKTSSN